ncbi:fumarylacetoacetate hydrolase family protein [Bacillus sp. Bva_UNVM-123]|uniref:fumarylacetoacetate hydrolase family protein n=1 Tax=Bacillus sp. Bva_UNVM-123 TaxID=2829798 RepID=UPI00391FA648
MKYISFFKKNLDKITNVGFFKNDHEIYDLTPIFSAITSLIEKENREELILNHISNLEVLSLDDIELCAPIPNPRRNIFCVGWNYLEHFEERHNQEIELPEKPTFFTKPTTTIAGPYEDIPLINTFTSKLDYEAELAVIIGKKGRDISTEDALNYVFGYMCANDISARDVQFEHGGQWFKGKSMDKSCPIGPYLVSANEIKNPQKLDISCEVNGETVQSSNTGLMNFSVAQIISELSQGLTLLPGDIILTGTPSGIGSKRNPPLFLKPNDKVTVKISELGQISNIIK